MTTTRPDWLPGERDYSSAAQSVFGRAPEQSALRDALRDLLSRRADLAAVRAAMDTELGYDPALWRTLGVELGLAGLAIAEEFGGSGASFVEVALVQEELGYALTCSPFLSSAVLAVAALQDAGPDAAEHLAALAGGEQVACLAVPDAGRAASGRLALQARSERGRWSIRGDAAQVLGGATADVVVAFAETPEGVALFVLHPEDRGLTRHPIAGLDLTRRAADMRFEDVPGRLVGTPRASRAALEATLYRGEVALAAEMLGGARRCLDMSVDYAKIRTQFGRPIGSFQAIKHRCADMFMGTYFVRPAVYYAAWNLEQEVSDEALVCSVAKAKASEVFFANATANIQIHGGIGYTWEHDAHLFLKRAAESYAYFGTPEQHRRFIASDVLAPTSESGG